MIFRRLLDVKWEDIKKAFIDVVCGSSESSQNSAKSRGNNDECPRGYVFKPTPCLYWQGGFTYRAWTSVVFLLLAGIAKPLMSVKNGRTSRFFVYVCVYTRVP